MLTVVPGDGSGHAGGKGGSPSLIDEIVREGARRMLAEALEAEVAAYVEAHAAERDERGRRLVVRNGRTSRGRSRPAPGAIEMTRRGSMTSAPTRTPGSGCGSASILPPWCRKTPKVAEVLPLMYLHGLSSR